MLSRLNIEEEGLVAYGGRLGLENIVADYAQMSYSIRVKP